MQPAVIEALSDWELAWTRAQEAATQAVLAAFPPLDHRKAPPYCCAVMLAYEEVGRGEGRLCIDNCLGTIEFNCLPNGAIVEAVAAVSGVGWFGRADGLLDATQPGAYRWDDKITQAQYEVVLGEDSIGTILISNVVVPDAAAVLDALTGALERNQSEPT